MDWIFYIGAGLTLILALALYFKHLQKTRRANLRATLLKQFGEIPNREYTHESLDAISHYYMRLAGEGETFHVDDITWNDLDMDRCFIQMNSTLSSAGEEYLYYMLRTPVQMPEPLEKREALISFFDANQEVRLHCQETFAQLGHTKKVSLSDYLETLVQLKVPGNMVHYLSLGVLVAALALLFISPSIGILALIAALIWDVSLYYKYKAEVENYFICVGYIARLTMAAESLEHYREAPLIEDAMKLKNALSSLRRMKSRVRYMGATSTFGGSLGDVLLEYLKIITHMDLIAFRGALGLVQNHIQEVEVLLEVLGEWECAIAIASYRRSLPFYAIPALTKEPLHLCLEDGYHPLMENPVANSIQATSGILITGSNASGKSTFLKMTAINSLMAQTIHTCTASSYSGCFFRLFSSMALKDNLIGKESYYIVEIKSLKRILDQISDASPILCFVDEVLRGTNTVERIAASAQILAEMASRNLLCFAATHDIELTHMLEQAYRNYHFQEEVANRDILFNYILQPGRSTTRNAIKLLGVMGYPDKVIQSAEETASRFMETGCWTLT